MEISKARRDGIKRIFSASFVLFSVCLFGVTLPTFLTTAGIVCLMEDCGKSSFYYWFVVVGPLITILSCGFIILFILPTCGYYFYLSIKEIEIPKYSSRNWLGL